MQLITDENFNGVYPVAVQDVLRHGDIVTIGSGPNQERRTLEARHVVLSVTDPWQHLVTAKGRPVNVAFALAEIVWILAGRNDVEFLRFWNSNIANFSDDGSTFNAAYGYRLRYSFGVDQLQDVFMLLTEDPASRQAVLQTWDPRTDRSFEPSLMFRIPTPRKTKDRACNTQSQLLIRDDKLHWMQFQRSNDLIWGTPYNYMQFSHIHRYMAQLLGVGMGEYTHVVNSLHIYEDFWEEAERIKPFNLYHFYEHPKWEGTDQSLIGQLEELIQGLSNPEARTPTSSDYSSLPKYWEGVMLVLAAHVLYKRKQDKEALDLLVDGDPVYGAAQARFYWANRWRKQERIMLSELERMYPAPVVEWICGEA